MPSASRRSIRRRARPSRARLWGEAAFAAIAFIAFVVGSSTYALLSSPDPGQVSAAPGPLLSSPGPGQVSAAPGPVPHPVSTGSYSAQVASGRKLLGVAPAGIKTDLGSLDSFARDIGRQPDVVEFYQGFNEPFDSLVAAGVSTTGALPLDSWGPAGASVEDIASGRDDAYITSYADQVRDFGGPIALTVGHEMNAPWSTWWGAGPAEAGTFAAAWRRIHTVFTQERADNVIWVWTVNIEAGGAVSPDPYYPGDGYVDWIGVDGYFHDGLPTTFDALFGPTLADLRAHYSQPILVVETGALATPLRPSEVQSAFNAVLGSSDLIGFIWFDYDLQSTDDVDWYLDDDGPSLAVYRRNATSAQFALRAPVAADTTPFYSGSAS